jgi:hypothetical protein
MTKTPQLSKVGAVIGVGQSDYVSDYARVRAGEKPHDSYGYAAIAFRDALTDAGIARDEIDGLIVGPTIAYERTGEILGINPRWGGQADAMLAVIEACMAIRSGMAEVAPPPSNTAARRRWAATCFSPTSIMRPGASPRRARSMR